MMNWKGLGRKRAGSNIKYNIGIFSQKDRRKPRRCSARIASVQECVRSVSSTLAVFMGRWEA
jgi:hypothetical protein